MSGWPKRRTFADPDDGRFSARATLGTQLLQVTPCQQAHGLGTGVVASPLVLGTRVAQPDRK